MAGALGMVGTATGRSTARAQEHVHSDPKNEELTKAALECARIGDDCIAHAFDMMKKGDTSLARCAELNSETVAATTALAKISALDSAHLRAFAKVVSAICEDCEQECLEHKHHMACMLSAEACRACIEACDALA